MTYYKAVRPDGTDFRTGTLLYGVGIVTKHPTSQKMVPGEANTYLSASTSPADCRGFWWPCRLLSVEPEGEVIPGPEDLPNKVCALAWRGIEELPSWQVFGPNGEAAVALLEKAETLTSEQWRKLYAAWNAARAAAGEAVWAAARAAARAAAWEEVWNAARDAAGEAAAAAAGDAAIALIVKDLISEEHFNALYGPWREVMEEESGVHEFASAKKCRMCDGLFCPRCMDSLIGNVCINCADEMENDTL